MIQKKHIKKITTFLLLIVTILTLVACTKKESVPYGNLTDKAYLSLGDINITEKEVYNNLRRQSGQALPKLIEEKLFEGYKEEAKRLLNTVDAEEGTDAALAQKAFDDLINTALFNTTDVETLRSLNDLNIRISINRFADSSYVQNSDVDREKIKTGLTARLNNEEDKDFATGYYKVEEIRDLYLIELQKRLYAQEVLAKEVLDKESSSYVSDANVINYYKNNVIDRHDADVFYFHFLSLNEANAALRVLSLKSNSRGDWFEIPDIRLVKTIEDYPEASNEYLWKVIKDTNLENKVSEVNDNDATKTKVTEEDFKRFYDAYSISTSNHEKLQPDQVLVKFVELYNVVNTKQLKIVDGTIVYESDNSVFETNKTYDDLTALNTSLRNYIYDTLTVEKPYSTLRSVGNFRYLLFKLDDNYNELNYVSEELDEDGLEKWVTIDELKEMLEDEDKKDDLLAALESIDGVVTNGDVDWEKLDSIMEANIKEWRAEVVKNRLTSSYISTKVNTILEEADIEIFDNTVRIFFNQSAANEAGGKGKTGDVLLTFKGELNDKEVKFEITVDEFYAYLEKTIGLETAIDLLLNKYLLSEYRKGNSDLFKDLELDEDSYRKEYREFINGFSNDQYASAGYPASIGREQFLLLIFGTTDLDEVIEVGYMIPELREAYSTNYDVHLGQTNIFKQLEYFTQLQYDKFKGLTVEHLLVYFDTDGDDSPEDPNEYFETLTKDEVDEIKDAIVDLYSRVLFEVGQGSLSGNHLTAIAEDFQSYARINLGDYKPELWETFRRHGLNLKFESLSGEITNSSNFPTSESGTLDPVFYDRAMKLYQIIVDDRNADDEDLVDGGLPYLDFGVDLNIVQDPEILTVDALDDLMSSFGFHFILVTNISENLSAKYSESDDTNEDYTVEIDDVTYNAYNDNEKISQTQIEYYIRGNKLDDGVLLPSKVNQAFNKYFTPVFNLYNNDIMRVELLNQLLDDNNVNLHGKGDRFEIVREINRNQFHGYLLGEDDNYDALYGEWFTKFGLLEG